MKNLTDLAKKDNAVMRALKVEQIAHVIAETNHGTLTLKLTKGQTGKDYHFVLDSVPVTDEIQKELMKQFNGVLFIQ